MRSKWVNVFKEIKREFFVENDASSRNAITKPRPIEPIRWFLPYLYVDICVAISICK